MQEKRGIEGDKDGDLIDLVYEDLHGRARRLLLPIRDFETNMMLRFGMFSIGRAARASGGKKFR